VVRLVPLLKLYFHIIVKVKVQVKVLGRSYDIVQCEYKISTLSSVLAVNAFAWEKNEP